MVHCQPDPNNPYEVTGKAVKVVDGDRTVGHVPRELAPIFFDLLVSGSRIKAEVIGKRQNTRNRGLEIPVKYILY